MGDRVGNLLLVRVEGPRASLEDQLELSEEGPKFGRVRSVERVGLADIVSLIRRLGRSRCRLLKRLSEQGDGRGQVRASLRVTGCRSRGRRWDRGSDRSRSGRSSAGRGREAQGRRDRCGPGSERSLGRCPIQGGRLSEGVVGGVPHRNGLERGGRTRRVRRGIRRS